MKKPFDRYVLTQQIAQGAGGALFAATEALPGGVTRPAMVKTLPPITKADPNAEKRFVDEVRVLAALAGHPNVVTFYGMGIADGGVPWIAMEQPSATLANVIGPDPAPVREVARMIEHVAQGLAALHGLTPPLLHNRLAASNVLACAASHYKVAEFGLAAPVSAEPTLSMESVRYAAPELLNKEFGRVGPAADLYALGHVAYEMALGAKLHRAQFPAVFEGVAKATDVNPARWQAWHHSIPTSATPAQEVVRGFPSALGEIIAKLMAKPLQSRYAAAAEVLADLARVTSFGGGGVAGAGLMEAPPAIGGARPAAGARPTFRPAPAGEMMMPPPLPADVPAGAAPSAAPARPSFGAPAAGDRYFVRLRNRTSGPFDLATLQRMARQGQLSRLHQVSTDQQNWKSAGAVDGVF